MITILLLAAAFVVGALVGALTLVALAIHREDGGHLPRRAPSRPAAAARNLMGLRISDTKPAVRGGLPKSGGHGEQRPTPGDGESPPFTGGRSR